MNYLRTRRMAVAAAVAGGSVLLLAGPAAAHVSVDPEEAEQGGYATVDFKVPNERDGASTVKLEVSLPMDHPLTSVMPEPVPGWDVEVEKTKLDKPLEVHGEKITEAASKVTWTGGEIGPGTFQRFPLSIGQLPEDADQLVFKTLQTYEGGEVVRWIEVPEEGGEEPESPAPVLALAPAGESGEPGGSGGSGGSGDSGDSGDSSDAKAAGDVAAEGGDTDDGGSTDTVALAFGIVGTVLGAAGVGFGLWGRRRSVQQ